MKILYRTEVTTSGGREGSSRTPDGTFEVKLGQPKELGGKGGPGTNPEQLFGAGWSACFLSAIRLVAGKQNVRLTPEAQVTAKIALGEREDGSGSFVRTAFRRTIRSGPRCGGAPERHS